MKRELRNRFWRWVARRLPFKVKFDIWYEMNERFEAAAPRDGDAAQRVVDGDDDA